jgi:uncharacterized protein (DUF305 family)
MKGVIRPDHIPKNKFKFMVNGLPDLTVVTHSGLEENTDAVDLPDKTKASGGRTNPVEFTVGIPAHHTEEINAMDAWKKEGEGDVQATYKKVAILTMMSLSGSNIFTHICVGTFITGRNVTEVDMGNDGEMEIVEYTLSSDDVMKQQ